MLQRFLLACGIASSVLYVSTDIAAAIRYEGYSYTSQAVSELMAVGAPTKQFVDSLFVVYDVLVIAFGVGVWGSGADRRHSRMTGALLIGVGAVGLTTTLYFPMNQRATAGTTSDAPHVVLTAFMSLFIVAAILAGSTLHGKEFRLYSWGTLATIVVFGALAGREGVRLAAHEPTPWLGVTERINIAAYLLWVLVLSVAHLRARNAPVGGAQLGVGCSSSTIRDT